MCKAVKIILTFWVMGCFAVQGALLYPSDVSYIIPGGSQSTTAPFKDDVMLSSITFGGVTYTAERDKMVNASLVYVREGRLNVNAEYGDLDNGSDGHDNPFVRAGIDTSAPGFVQDSADPSILEPALLEALSTLSLSEGFDGESSPYTLAVAYEYGINDNDLGIDEVPEIMLFERGRNSSLSVRAIIGGTLVNPIYAANTVFISETDFAATGIFIDTQEINQGQELGGVGVDLSDFFTPGNAETVYGLEFSSDDGADIYGQFSITGGQDAVVNDVVTQIPEPAAISFVLLAMLSALISKRLFGNKLSAERF